MTTRAGFLSFIRDRVGISATYLPDNSTWIDAAYNLATQRVSEKLQGVLPVLYDEALYNLATDILIGVAQDVVGKTYFADLRKQFKILEFAPGVIQSASDVSTSESLFIPDFMKNLTFADLRNLKTPYGRAYLEIAQQVGGVWGVS